MAAGRCEAQAAAAAPWVDAFAAVKLAHEAGGTDTADPLGGAYFIEALTDELEAAAR